jgi:hypothetical protein
VHPRQALPREDLRNLIEDRVDEGHPLAVRGEPVTRTLDRGRIPVESEQPQLRPRGQQRGGMPAAPQSRVYVHGPRNGKGGCEKVDDPVQHDRIVSVM